MSMRLPVVILVPFREKPKVISQHFIGYYIILIVFEKHKYHLDYGLH